MHHIRCRHFYATLFCMKAKAFTLIELLVTVTIIVILSGMAIMGLSSIRQKAQDTTYLSSLRDLQISLEAYKSVNGSYPTQLTDLTPTYISKIPTDPGQTSSSITYSVYADKKTYCLYVRNRIFKPMSQLNMYSAACPNSWTVCKGPDTTSLTQCTGITSS